MSSVTEAVYTLRHHLDGGSRHHVGGGGLFPGGSEEQWTLETRSGPPRDCAARWERDALRDETLVRARRELVV